MLKLSSLLFGPALLAAVAIGGLAETLPPAPHVIEIGPADDVCGEPDEIAETLRKGYGEKLVATMIEASGLVMVEIYASEKTGTWTFMTITPGPAKGCLVGSGTAFRLFGWGEGA